MSFDIKIAIAKMETADFHHSSSGIEALAEHYPELKFVFDELLDLRSDVSTHGHPADLVEAAREGESESARLYDLIDEAQDRLTQARDMVLTLLKFDDAAPLKPELTTLANTLDDGHDYLQIEKDAC